QPKTLSLLQIINLLRRAFAATNLGESHMLEVSSCSSRPHAHHGRWSHVMLCVVALLVASGVTNAQTAPPAPAKPKATPAPTTPASDAPATRARHAGPMPVVAPPAASKLNPTPAPSAVNSAPGAGDKKDQSAHKPADEVEANATDAPAPVAPVNELDKLRADIKAA